MNRDSIDVSIVIVCMNNLHNLYPCLESIRKYTTEVTYETFVVAYLFTKEKLEKAKADFPWVTFIESNEFRGFSENNNLALKQAKGKYCFVLNDDTEIQMPVIDGLFETIENLPQEVAAISPRSVFGDSMQQSCGRPKHTIWTYILSSLKMWDEQKSPSPFVNQKGVFKTYDLWGAFFLIKTDVFRQMGWFDERYFFSPEDIALSRKLNRAGYHCYVDSNITIIHYEGMTGKGTSPLQLATKPVSFKGNLIYYADESSIRYFFISLLFFVLAMFSFIFHFSKSITGSARQRNRILYHCDVNCMSICFSDLTPKQIFMKYAKPYLKLK